MDSTLLRLSFPSARSSLLPVGNYSAEPIPNLGHTIPNLGHTFTRTAWTNCIPVLQKENKLLHPPEATAATAAYPTMSDIVESSRAQNMRLHLQTLGPFFRVRAVRWDDERQELGRAEGVIRPWIDGSVLHLDSMRMSRATLSMERSIFGLGLFIGAAAVRHGYDCGCARVELLAIYDSEEYHKKLVKFYTRMGFRTVREVEGMTIGDAPHMLVWGGKGTRMDADITDLMIKWGKRFRQPQQPASPMPSNSLS